MESPGDQMNEPEVRPQVLPQGVVLKDGRCLRCDSRMVYEDTRYGTGFCARCGANVPAKTHR